MRNLVTHHNQHYNIPQPYLSRVRTFLPPCPCWIRYCQLFLSLPSCLRTSKASKNRDSCRYFFLHLSSLVSEFFVVFFDVFFDESFWHFFWQTLRLFFDDFFDKLLGYFLWLFWWFFWWIFEKLFDEFFDQSFNECFGEFFGVNSFWRIFWRIFFDNFFDDFFGRFLLTYNLLTIPSFRIGVPSLLFFQKFQNIFGGEDLHQLGYFDTLPSLLSLIKIVLWRLQRWAFFLFSNIMPDRVNRQARKGLYCVKM